MTDKPTNPEGEPITLKYLRDAYARAMTHLSPEQIRTQRQQAWRDAQAWLASKKPIYDYDGWGDLRAKMRRDATISVIKAKCGVR